MEYQKVDLTMDATGRTQTLDQRIARVVSMFQAGRVREEIAKDVIRRLGTGEAVREVETTIPAPLDAVAATDRLKDIASEAQAQIARAQGLTPKRKLSVDE